MVFSGSFLMDGFPLFGTEVKATQQVSKKQETAPVAALLLSGTEIKPSEEVEKEQTSTPATTETSVKKEQSWSDYLPSFGWHASTVPQEEKKSTNQVNVVKVLNDTKSNKSAANETCDDSEITEQCCNTTAHYVNVIKQNASEIEVEALPASMIESSTKKGKSKKVSFGAKSPGRLTSELEGHMLKEEKKSRGKRSKRSRKKDELKKYLKKSLKAYLKETGPNTTPKSVESEMKKLEKSVEQMVHSAVEKERDALLHTVPIIDERQEAPVSVTSAHISTGIRQDPEAVVTMQPSREKSAMSSFQEEVQSKLRDLSSFSKNTQIGDIEQLLSHNAVTSTVERDLPSEPEPSFDDSALRQSKSQDAATRWEAYMKNLRAKRGGNINASAAALEKGTLTEKEHNEDKILKMKKLEEQIAEESVKISLEMTKGRESYMACLDEEVRDESGHVTNIDTREGMNTSFQLQHHPSFPSVITSSSSIVSTSTMLLSTEAKFALEEQIQAEMAELQAVQDKFTYNMNMAAYSKRRPTILKSDLFSKSVFDRGPLKSKEAEKVDTIYQKEMENLRAKQADLFAKGRELTQF